MGRPSSALQRLADLLLGPTKPPPAKSVTVQATPPPVSSLPPFQIPGNSPGSMGGITPQLPPFEEPGGSLPIGGYMQPPAPGAPPAPMQPPMTPPGGPSPVGPPPVGPPTELHPELQADVAKVLENLRRRSGIRPPWMQDQGNLGDQSSPVG